MVNMIGQKFGRLTVLDVCNKLDKFSNKMYKCKCDCGNIVEIRGNSLKTGNNKSCGCLRGTNHGMSNTALYYIWNGIKERCYNKNYSRYHNHGGRGIKVCDAWLHDFMNFYNWATNNNYQEGLTIDRIDNNGNYEPSNCRWVDKKIQNRNKRNNINFTINGETKCLAEWCEILNLNYSTVRKRLKLGWPVEKAFELEAR